MDFRLNFYANDYQELAQSGLIIIEACCQLNEFWLKKYPNTPTDPFSANLKYDPPPLAYRTHSHRICQIPVLLARGHGKCDSITAYDVAARRMRGEKAWPAIVDQGNGLYHVVTKILQGNKPVLIDSSEKLPRYQGSDSCNLTGMEELCNC